MLAAQGVRLFGMAFLYESLERYSIVLSLAGVILLVRGGEVLYRVRWIVAFMLLMVPFPGRIHNLIADPLQTLATDGAVFMLELLGVAVVRSR